MASGGLQSRLQNIEKDLRNLKENALLVKSENLKKLVEVIDRVARWPWSRPLFTNVAVKNFWWPW